MKLSEADHAKVSAAIAEAEKRSNGEIVAVATPISDSYHDVALHWAVAALLLVLAWAALRPGWLLWWHEALTGGWRPEPTLGEILLFLMLLATVKFVAVLLILRWMPLRLALTPRATKARAGPTDFLRPGSVFAVVRRCGTDYISGLRLAIGGPPLSF